ncbi:MAG TPA: PilZ domain-containing protein [Candidatus Omnitrophota bacterium]|nr:PilZ domain-containing protein [Candidatus Omnitrophota bacterium]HPD85219.1 PilZ domain-containing protein [Candidatus Omnitrophota bacterium]HRZ04280.1 PilZ domain-containing protein [Candidatus Omnitrophota bacterium]
MANSNTGENQNGTDRLVEERRKFIRLSIDVQINYSVLSQADQHRSITKNIGEGGICLVTDGPLNAGTLLKLEIILPEDPPPIQTVGKIVWIKTFSLANENRPRYEAGVQFINISERDQLRIGKYVFSVRAARSTGI